MMMMKATRGTTFNYASTYWTAVNTLNTTSLNRNDGDAKFDAMNYFFAKDSVYAKKFSHHIFDQAKKTVIEILNKASIQFRRDQMWVEQSDWV